MMDAYRGKRQNLTSDVKYTHLHYIFREFLSGELSLDQNYEHLRNEMSLIIKDSLSQVYVRVCD